MTSCDPVSSSPVTAVDEMLDDVDDIDIDVHACPVCGVDVVRYVWVPGRARVYCTNACRQKAYRWRRARGIRLCVDRTGPTGRMINGKRHAVRDERDPVSGLRDARRREVSVCGAFARRISAEKVTHTNFIPDHPFSCATCAELVGASTPYHGIPPHLFGIITFPPRHEPLGGHPVGRPVGWGPMSIR